MLQELIILANTFVLIGIDIDFKDQQLAKVCCKTIGSPGTTGCKGPTSNPRISVKHFTNQKNIENVASDLFLKMKRPNFDSQVSL